MTEITVNAKTVAELNLKIKAVRVLTPHVEVFATGDFRSDKNDLLFFRTLVTVKDIGRVYVSGIVDGKMMKFKPDPTDDDTWGTTFIIHGQE